MTLTRWDPFNDLVKLQERMNRLFEDSMRRSGAEGGEGLATGAWTPSVDIFETADSVVLVADLPGVELKDIELRVESNTLTLRGERRMKTDVRQENYHRIERSYGGFSRAFSIPATVDEEKIRADYKEGVLKIALPKKEQAKAKQIRITE